MGNVSRWRPGASIFALLLILVGAFQLDYLRVFVTDRDALAERIDHLRFGKMPELRPWLMEIEARTEPGEAILLVVPGDWNTGYEYAFYRASYVLAGRTILPIMTPGGSRLTGNVEQADYVAFWRVPFDVDRVEIVWEGEGGVLARPK